MSAFVVHGDTSVFGDDANIFNPERWYRSDARNMDSHLFHVTIHLKRMELSIEHKKKLLLIISHSSVAVRECVLLEMLVFHFTPQDAKIGI